jgi:hypothetical protein
MPASLENVTSATPAPALQLLADIPFATKATMFANGITRKTLVSLIRVGLATTQREIKAGGQTVGRQGH